VLKELKSQYQWKSWQFREEDHLENYCSSDENDDKRLVAQLDSDGTAELMSYVIYELKTNFKNIRRVVELDDTTMRGMRRNMRTLVLLHTWIDIYAANVNAAGKKIDVAAQVSPIKEKEEVKDHSDVGTQTEGKEDSAVRKKQSEVGTQTEASIDVKTLTKRKEISPIVDNQTNRKKPWQSVGSYAEVCSGVDNVGGR
jgi:hypothetical protein